MIFHFKKKKANDFNLILELISHRHLILIILASTHQHSPHHVFYSIKRQARENIMLCIFIHNMCARTDVHDCGCVYECTVDQTRKNIITIIKAQSNHSISLLRDSLLYSILLKDMSPVIPHYNMSSLLPSRSFLLVP